jgi:hypothetical protein
MSSQPPWQRRRGPQTPQGPQQPPAQPPPVQPPPAQAPPAPPPTAEPPQPAPAQPTSPGAVQAPPPPGPGAPSAPPPGVPPVFAPPPGGPRKTNTKLIVAIVGAVAVLGIGGSVVALASGKDEQPPPPPPPCEGPDCRNEDDPPPPPPEPSLQELIQEQVGDFALIAAEQDPQAISAGASDAYITKYEAGDVRLSHILMAFNSPEEAQESLANIGTSLEEDGFVLQGEPQPLTGEGGEQIGILAILLNEQTGTEAWGWTNGTLTAFASSAVGQVEKFYVELPY